MRQNTLRVRLLGPVDLQLDNQPLPPLDSARAESLLAAPSVSSRAIPSARITTGC